MVSFATPKGFNMRQHQKTISEFIDLARKLAVDDGMNTLAYLLEMAILENASTESASATRKERTAAA